MVSTEFRLRRVAYIPSVKKDQVECRSIHIVRGIGVATERSVAKVGARSARVREAHDIVLLLKKVRKEDGNVSSSYIRNRLVTAEAYIRGS